MNEMIIEMLDEFDHDTFTAKGLYEDEKFTERYYTVIKNYKVLLDKYLLNKLQLKEMDDKVANSGLAFIPVENDNMDFYQKFSTMKLKYIYLRNFLYVHKLTNEDIDTIINLSVNQLRNPSVKLLELIDSTYKDVINAGSVDKNEDVVYKKCYGIDSDDYWLDSDSLVFGFRHDEFADNGLGDGDEWGDNYNKQLDFLADLLIDNSKLCSDILNMKVKFLYFDDISVMRTMGKSK